MEFLSSIKTRQTKTAKYAIEQGRDWELRVQGEKGWMEKDAVDGLGRG